jgi:hypothetical protein
MEESRTPEKQRSARNQAIFRRANEALRERYGELGVGDVVPFLCECADVRCTRTLRMTLAEFDEIRLDARLFAVVSGHARADIEAVVVRSSGYDVVVKQYAPPE